MLKRVTAKSEQKSWTDQAAYAAALSESAALRAKGDAKGAVQRLDGVKPPRELHGPGADRARARRGARGRGRSGGGVQTAWPRSPRRRRPMRSSRR